MALLKLIERSAIKEDTLTQVVVNDQKIILFEYNGTVKAYQGKCPHEGAPLAEGHIENGRIVCPLHRWEFACDSGMNDQHKKCLQSYSIKEKEGFVFLEEASLLQDQQSGTATKVKTIRDLPSPKGSFILGHVPQFKAENKHQIIERWVEECGPLFKLNMAGKKFVVSADPEMNKSILKNRPEAFRRFTKIDEVISEIGIKGVFNAEGDVWKRHRKLTSEALNLRRVKGFFPIIAKTTGRLYEKLNESAKQNTEVDVLKDMMRYTVDITTEMAFGYPMNTLNKEGDVIQNHLEKIFPMINRRFGAPIPTWRFIRSKKDKEFDQAVTAIENTVHSFIDKAKKRLADNPELKENPSNFLEALLVEQENEGNFSDKEVYSNVFSILLAGEDTTSNSISWALFYLAQNPHMVARVRQEANHTYRDQKYPSSYQEMSALKYTEAVANEAIRIKPVAPLMFYDALEDTEVNGFLFKKGSSMIMQTKVAQTHEAHFFDPNTFFPERWLKSECPAHANHKPESIMAFGGGPRYCPGKNLAVHEMVMALSMICKNFDLELTVNPNDVKEVFAFSMHPDNLKVRFKSI